ncbi:hypothetical protein P3S68_030208 [Capsicum galapagoense]
MAKVRVEVDLTKPKINVVWIGSEDTNNPLKGYNQKIEYENVPKFCRHCKILRHNILQCRNMEKKEGEKDKEKKDHTDGNNENEQKEEKDNEVSENLPSEIRKNSGIQLVVELKGDQTNTNEKNKNLQSRGDYEARELSEDDNNQIRLEGESDTNNNHLKEVSNSVGISTYKKRQMQA